jgi:hypothetical protein
MINNSADRFRPLLLLLDDDELLLPKQAWQSDEMEVHAQ